MNKLLEGKAGIVTGAASGIGRESAVLFAKEGAKVLVSDLNEEKGNETVELIRKEGGEAYFFKCDVSNEENVKEMVAFAVEKFGKLDYAFNNAGVASLEPVPVHETTTEIFKKIVDINIMGMYYSMKYEVPHMLEAGAGAIVNCCSISSVRGTPTGSAYGASKFGAYGLTQCVALEYAKSNIRVNAIGPGPTKTPMIQAAAEANPALISAIEAGIPDGRMGEATEIANTALFLISGLSTHINGQIVIVDGGTCCTM